MGLCCQPKRFANQKYFFKDDTLAQGCVLFREDHEDKLETLFREYNTDLSPLDFAEWVCGDSVTKACKNVDPASLTKPVFFLNDVAQDSSVITMGYGANPNDPKTSDL